jgi:hypothetical protein
MHVPVLRARLMVPDRGCITGGESIRLVLLPAGLQAILQALHRFRTV